MSPARSSAYKVPYEIRSAKQVERHMMMDVFERLSRASFPIGDYQYTGFGALTFVDFIMFHRFLGLKKLVSVEYDASLKSRVEYNRPFGCVEIEIDLISNVIPKLDRDTRHILWLDYDYPIDKSIAADFSNGLSILPTSSILIVTVDVEPPDPDAGPKEWRETYEEEVGHYLRAGLSDTDFAQSVLPRRNIEAIQNIIGEAMAVRAGVVFEVLFSFLYSDGHQMLTIGGVIAGEAERRQIAAADLEHAKYARRSLDAAPYEINVPMLTRKERNYLDKFMPCEDTWRPRAFKLSKDDVLNYRDIYRFFPSYAELFLG